jgi:hypothetical protein
MTVIVDGFAGESLQGGGVSACFQRSAVSVASWQQQYSVSVAVCG